MLAGLPKGEWAEGDAEGIKAALRAVLGTNPADYGGYGQGNQIDANSEAFKSLARYRYRVYAIGYNWLKSNEVSGKQVLDGFDHTDQRTKKVIRVMGIREIFRENNTEKAIIITHSMGGLVARMASQFHGGEHDMYGVIHGAQPATGAPLFARLRTPSRRKSNELLPRRFARSKRAFFPFDIWSVLSRVDNPCGAIDE